MRVQPKGCAQQAEGSEKEKAVHLIEDDLGTEPEPEVVAEEGFDESLGITGARAEGVDPGDLRMDDYDE